MLVSQIILALLSLGLPDPVCYRLFVLKQSEGAVVVEPVDVVTAEGEARRFTCGAETGVIDVILPVGPGGSGSLIRLAERRELSVACRNREIAITEHAAGGKTWQRPLRRLDDLEREETRVSVIGAGALRTSVRLVKTRDVVADEAGGVEDPFEGRVPIAAGDFVVGTETHPCAAGPELEGTAKLEVKGWPFVKATAPDGSERWLVLDLGAGATVLARDFLPADTAIETQSMTEYSGAQKRLLKYAPGGATGAVESIAGAAVLEALEVPELSFEAARVDVMASLPGAFGRPVAGILGLDLLRRARIVSLELDGEHPRLSLAHEPSEKPPAFEVPFSIVRSHLVVAGTVNGTTVRFFLDTGSTDSILDEAAAAVANVAWLPSKGTTAGGLDGGSVPIAPAAPTALTLGDRVLEPVAFQVSALATFAPLRVPGQAVGLLGNAFFARFARFSIDFERRVVGFWTKEAEPR